LAIQKAKKYGVGFVACQNSTHYGIAGYYATMASQQGISSCKLLYAIL
jgi:L-2-hydroxycarboxylate dehydrogenase (NAD+)